MGILGSPPTIVTNFTYFYITARISYSLSLSLSFYLSLFIYIYIYSRVCVCVCVCGWVSAIPSMFFRIPHTYYVSFTDFIRVFYGVSHISKSKSSTPILLSVLFLDPFIVLLGRYNRIISVPCSIGTKKWATLRGERNKAEWGKEKNQPSTGL